jgi:PIN domain nuclease of toxin-antitoxin system
VLWAAASTDNLPGRRAMSIVDDPQNELLFSAATIWEIAIKTSLGDPRFDVDPHLLRRELLNNGYDELPITGAHAAMVARLPRLHKDPFDRILIAQAMVENLPLVTVDDDIARYDLQIITP